MSYTVVKKITPSMTQTFDDIASWKEVHGPYHGTKAGVVLRSEWQLDADKKSAIITLVYPTKETYERHTLRTPEEYFIDFSVEVLSTNQDSLD